ncbi:MAG TPA: polyphosphate kinase 2 family protein [bacterium]|nr:polyphosphate kinase 2 family protein [bacterium]HNT64985.1 polyphosphate kinase 2 family protein [bacterium]HOX84393.1 polyphosphate kinase 2 family protein [bacterium]HPG46010.1 polyphosphate kinase 2 family protein [bacterium]HPM97832.1 polyphosphate kinase 2 family protein [bacterium]
MHTYQVQSGKKITLKDWDPADLSLWDKGKKEGIKETEKLVKELQVLQEKIYAQQKHRILVVIQGMDTSGKDGAIRHVFGLLNPQGVFVKNFKVPTAVEIAHDYLWRVHAHVPGNGEIVLFNRSHYEDVLVVRVHNLVPRTVWQKRYDHINQFERMLADEGTTLFKFFLHISKDEQKERLQARLDDPLKHWKFNVGDLEERKVWDEYTTAYNHVLSRTSTEWAPWIIVPSNRKWYRNLVIAKILVEKLGKMDIKFPDPQSDLKDIKID